MCHPECMTYLPTGADVGYGIVRAYLRIPETPTFGLRTIFYFSEAKNPLQESFGPL